MCKGHLFHFIKNLSSGRYLYWEPSYALITNKLLGPFSQRLFKNSANAFKGRKRVVERGAIFGYCSEHWGDLKVIITVMDFRFAIVYHIFLYPGSFYLACLFLFYVICFLSIATWWQNPIWLLAKHLLAGQANEEFTFHLDQKRHKKMFQVVDLFLMRYRI